MDSHQQKIIHDLYAELGDVEIDAFSEADFIDEIHREASHRGYRAADYFEVANTLRRAREAELQLTHS